MKKISIERNHLIFTIIMLVLVVIGGTFAWFTYQSRKSALVLSIGDINDSKVIIKPYQIRKTLAPVNTYTSGVYSQITAINNNDDAIPLTFFYKINQLDEILINNGLKYTVVSSNSENGTYTEVVTGNFSNISNNQLVVLETEIAANTTTYYRIYVWLDSSVANQNDVVNSVLNIELNGSIDTVVSFDDHTPMITSYTCDDSSGNPVTVGNNPYFTYTGQCEVIDDGNGDWRIRFLTDGTFTSTLNIPIDAFLVGGGGGGGTYGGGGGGYTNTTFVNLKENTAYSLTIGAGGVGGSSGESGGNTLGFGALAQGGGGATYNSSAGGNGGSGGSGGSGGGGVYGDGGSDGSDGETADTNGGTGQERTTREFGEETGDLYAGGGGGGSDNDYVGGLGGTGGGANGGGTEEDNISASDNTGGGGGGASEAQGDVGGAGGSGIIVIRNSRNTSGIQQLPGVGFDFTYTGNYTVINDSDGNWRIKFLTSGTFVSSKDVYIDAFLVGGGGGGGTYGGGGGGYTNTTFVNLKANTEYSLTIGTGGNGSSSGTAGGNTLGFGAIAQGGEGAESDTSTGHGKGGAGGSGGGGYGNPSGGAGGSDGSDGSNSSMNGGTGQERTTREFDESTGDLYAGGGGGGSDEGPLGSGGSGGGGSGGLISYGSSGSVNTGGGGGGAGAAFNSGGGGSGGSGIIVIRNSRNTSGIQQLPGVGFDFTYTGNYTVINDSDGNWRIKFLTSGTFVSSKDVYIDAFLVGGGGGGGTYSGGGGGKTLTTSVDLTKDTEYKIVIGTGGNGSSSGGSGGNSSAFGKTVNGGSGGSENGGAGGSGGGGYGNPSGCAGGSDGSNGESGETNGGTGQGSTTREFGVTDAKLYAGGGGGGSDEGPLGSGGSGGGGSGGLISYGSSGSVNTGGGGGGAGAAFNSGGGGSGGSGIVIIRNARD